MTYVLLCATMRPCYLQVSLPDCGMYVPLTTLFVCQCQAQWTRVPPIRVPPLQADIVYIDIPNNREVTIFEQRQQD